MKIASHRICQISYLTYLTNQSVAESLWAFKKQTEGGNNNSDVQCFSVFWMCLSLFSYSCYLLLLCVAVIFLL